VGCNKLISIGLLLWYLAVSVWMAQAPVDPQFWLLASILPALPLSCCLIVTHRLSSACRIPHMRSLRPFSRSTRSACITPTPRYPIGVWMDQVLHLGRNHFDRIVHFSFGFLLAYPMEELFRLSASIQGWVVYYLPVMTVLGLSGLWEIIESWVARAVHPELGVTYFGSQGDIWDAQKDMAAALYGSLLSHDAAPGGARPAWGGVGAGIRSGASPSRPVWHAWCRGRRDQ
jgi:putative membrane protein